MQRSGFTFTKSEATLLNGEYMAPNGQKNLQKGLLTKSIAANIDMVIPTFIQKNGPIRLLIIELPIAKGIPASMVPTKHSFENHGSMVK